MMDDVDMIKRFMVFHNIKVEGIDSSKSTVNQKDTDVIQVNDREKEDEQTPCSKVVWKRSAEKGVSDVTAYKLDGDESATESIKLKCVKLEPKN
ncbi:hypothetical protein MtrunA17_Chr6g0480811 [Medicago truncatula]|uniref:Uncharacterized protein n=1 Tax=Medicago truncatula TaxID=3880 RepID=A0A396HIW3_MEDTR|nr:hypothetical protein MtrunA17_Chr6g0480811 [Medicago truncatula]